MLSKSFLAFIDDFVPETRALVARAIDAFGLASFSCPSSEPRALTLHLPPWASSNLTFRLRNPYLIPFQLFGLLIGLRGFLQRQNSNSAPELFRYSALFFGLMNASSLLCHNIFARYSKGWEVARVFDVVFTGTSALLLVALALPRRFLPKDPKRTAGYVFVSLLAYNVVTDAYQGVFKVPWTSDLTYLGTMILAALVLTPKLLQLGLVRQSVSFWATLLGFQIVFLSLPLDNVWCWISEEGSVWRTTGLLLLFGGCDMIFLGLAGILAEAGGLEGQSPEKSKGKKT